MSTRGAGTHDAEMLNPFFRLGFADSDERGRIRVVSLRRHHGWCSSVVDRETQPRLFALLHDLLTSNEDLDLDLTDDALDELRAIGLWVVAEQVPNEVIFRAPLDESPSPSPHGADATGGEHATWIVNPTLSFAAPHGVVPPGGDAVWMTDARTGVNAPYDPGELSTALRACVPGRVAPPLARATCDRLRRAGVLVTPSRQAELAADRANVLARAARDFAARGYAQVPELLPSAQLRALQRYYRQILDEGYLRFGDRQVARRYAQHNEPIARLFLVTLEDIVSTVVGESVKPSYAYFASYREGAVLERHRDRAQCAFSISFLVDYAPAPDGPSPWPLWVGRDPDVPGTPLHQSIGEAIFYRGCELYHWRDALAPRSVSTHLFLHYVAEDFAGALA